jgi:hypothetical protein
MSSEEGSVVMDWEPSFSCVCNKDLASKIAIEAPPPPPPDEATLVRLWESLSGRQFKKIEQLEEFSTRKLNEQPRVIKEKFDPCKLGVKELHEYLVSKLVTDQEIFLPPSSSEVIGIGVCVELESYVRESKKYLDLSKSNLLKATFVYSDWIEVAAAHFHFDGNSDKHFEAVLQSKRFSDSAIKRMRTLANSLGRYKKLRFLSLSFTELYKLIKPLRAMFALQPRLALFWEEIRS